MEIIPIKTRIFRENESLLKFIEDHLSILKEGDVVVITSKIVALAQGRTAEISDKEGVIKRESDLVIKTKWCYLAKKDGDWLPNVGVDESNASDKIILLPSKPYQVARNLWQSLKQIYHLKKLGVILTDTRSRPLRTGTTGITLAYTGFLGFKDYRGKKDLFGRKLKYTQSNLVDALAIAGVAVMGEGEEQIPLALIHGAPIKYSDRFPDSKELLMDPRRDLYRPIFTSTISSGRRFQKRANHRQRDK